MLELVQRCLADEDLQETVVRMSLGLVGDLADAFPNGQIKQYLLVEWLSTALRQKARLTLETKKTIRWAKEVSLLYRLFFSGKLVLTLLPQMVKRATA